MISAMLTMISGIYVPNTDVYPAHFRGMGIRIEDSVCVQEEHPFVLTTEAVKEVRLTIPDHRVRLTDSSAGR